MRRRYQLFVCLALMALALVMLWTMSQADIAPISSGQAQEGARPIEGRESWRTEPQRSDAPFNTPSEHPTTIRDTPTVPSGMHRLRGIALEDSGEELVGVTLDYATRSGSRSTVCDATGAFELSGDLFAGPLRVSCANHILVRASVVSTVEDWNRLHKVVFAKCLKLAGRVAAEDGAAIAGAKVSVRASGGSYLRVQESLERTRQLAVEVTTTATGEFTMSAPALRHAEIVVSANGYEQWHMDLPLKDDDRLLVTMVACQRIPGMVFHQNGGPVETALVRLDSAKTRSNKDGKFLLEVRAATRRDAAMVASLPGFQSAVIPAFLSTYPRGRLVTLRLGAESLSIVGTLQHSLGEPCSNWYYYLVDGHDMGTGETPPDFAENPTNSGVVPRTDATGRFAIQGLFDQSYRIRFWNADTLETLTSQAIKSGTDDVIVTVPRSHCRSRVIGYVSYTDGSPVQGARVRLTLKEHQNAGAVSYISRTPVTSAADGQFVLADVPGTSLSIRVDDGLQSATRFGSCEVDLAPEELGPLKIAVARTHELRVRCVGGQPADRLSILDAKGGKMLLEQRELGMSTVGRELRLFDGNAPSFWVTESARSVVLSRPGAADQALLLRWAADGPTVVTY